MKFKRILIILPIVAILFSCNNSVPTSIDPICGGQDKLKLDASKLKTTEDTYTIPNSEITLTRGNYYTKVEEVAAYVIAFGFLPTNYVLYRTSTDRSVCGETYGLNCRLYKDTYSNGPGHDSPILTDGASKYYEADMESENGLYSSSSRGVYRIVFSVDEGHEIVYYTNDHYDHFSEYYNYYGGWGEWFGDVTSTKHPFTSIWSPGIEADNINYSCFIKDEEI